MIKLSGEQKVVFKNGIYIYILNAVNTFIPMLTIPYVTRILGSAGYGQFSIALNIITYLQVLVEYGFAMYGARIVAVKRDSRTLSEYFSRIFITRVFLCIVSIVVLSVYLCINAPEENIAFCVMILFLLVLGSMFQQNWLLQGLEKMQYITIIGVISRLISCVCIFLFIRNSDQVLPYCFFYSATNFLTGLFGFVFVQIKIGVRLHKIKFSTVLYELKEASYTFLSVLSGRIMTSFGVTVLGIYATQSLVGVYSAINKIPTIMTMAFSPISQAIFPYLSKKFGESFDSGLHNVKKIAIPILLVFLVPSILIMVLSGQIVRIAFGDEYAVSHTVLYILMPWMMFGILNNFLGIQILVGSDNSKYYGMNFFATAFVSIIANILLVPRNGIYGAATALLISEASLSILNIIAIYKVKRN